jgi:hypothetical protein
MTSKPQEPPSRAPVRIADWAADATEARRQRDEAVKQRTTALQQQRRQTRAATDAGSPQHEISPR